MQSSILLALGLQRKTVEDVEAELQLPVAQSLALFVKTIRKMTKALSEVQKRAIEDELPDRQHARAAGAVLRSLPEVRAVVAEGQFADELDKEGEEVLRQLREEQKEVINSLDLKQ